MPINKVELSSVNPMAKYYSVTNYKTTKASNMLEFCNNVISMEHIIIYNKKPQLWLTNPRDIMFARYLPSNCRVTLKLWVGVTQGHRKCHHLVARVWFPIRHL